MPRLIVSPPKRLWTPPRPIPTPTEADVERYKRLRLAGRRLNQRLTATVPRRAMEDIGRALDILRNGTLIFGSKHVTNVHMDCCLYDWMEGGRSLVRKFAEESPPPEGSDEREVIEAYLRARYSLLRVEECVPGAGVRATDILRDREIFLLDMGMSSCPGIEGGAVASRIIPIGEFWMTSGAILPMGDNACEALLIDLPREEYYVTSVDEAQDTPEFVLAVVRSCLRSGAADLVRYEHQDEEDPESSGAAVRPIPRRSSRNAPCPCGSGRQYKRCCGRRQRARAS